VFCELYLGRLIGRAYFAVGGAYCQDFMVIILLFLNSQYDFTTWGGVLFCAALALFFLSIFTPLWLALETTVCHCTLL